MLRHLFTTIFFLVVSSIVFSQTKLGEVACVYVTTPNLDSSAAVYEKLGFPKTMSNTIPVPWVQVSDGSLLIMMRKDATPYIGLTYYVTDIDKTVTQLEKDGIVFSQKSKETDPIKRYYIKTPDGFNIMLANNLGAFTQPTGKTLLDMKPEDYQSADKFPNKQCGVFGEFCHPVTDLNSSITYWKKLGFEVKGQMTAPYPMAILTDGKMIIGLHQTKNFSYPAVTYFSIDTDKRIQQLKEKGVTNYIEFMGKNNVVVNTWEGQHFFLFTLGM